MSISKTELYNWGMYPKHQATVISPDRIEGFTQNLEGTQPVIARGNGRCYGDSALQNSVFSTLKLNKIISFSSDSGLLTCEAGVSLDDILQVVVPKGFFLPVTPGTKFITLGGAIASNIHGKNHHKEGALSAHLINITLLLANGTISNCSRTECLELFRNTIGGMGLTGIILSATIQLKKIETSYIKQKSIKAKNLDEVINLFGQYNHYTYSVAWIDCVAKGNKLGRSILMLGEHAKLTDLTPKQSEEPLSVHPNKQINVPFNLPTFTLNQLTVKAFNMLYYGKQFKKEQNSITHYNPYFYPLDAINNWNRLYGKNGFTQYQFVLPFASGKEGLRKILEKVAKAGEASFLAVLKTFGESDNVSAPISFPMPGYTLALDFKVSKKVFKLLDELDELVIAHGGRLYLTKDARMSSETFSKTYSESFKHDVKFHSLQSERLGI